METYQQPIVYSSVVNLFIVEYFVHHKIQYNF